MTVTPLPPLRSALMLVRVVPRSPCRSRPSDHDSATVTPSSLMLLDFDSSTPVVLRSSCVRTSDPVRPCCRDAGIALVRAGRLDAEVAQGGVRGVEPAAAGDDDVGPALRVHRERLPVRVGRGDGHTLDGDATAARVEERRVGRSVAAAELQGLDTADVERRARGQHDGRVELGGVSIDREERVRHNRLRTPRVTDAGAGSTPGQAATGDRVDRGRANDDQLLRPSAPVPRGAGLRGGRGGLRGALGRQAAAAAAPRPACGRPRRLPPSCSAFCLAAWRAASAPCWASWRCCWAFSEALWRPPRRRRAGPRQCPVACGAAAAVVGPAGATATVAAAGTWPGRCLGCRNHTAAAGKTEIRSRKPPLA